ncbi:MAG: hypothetical protein CM15mV9_1380 [uncultured marine virus]|nr:MAG: hypothetical protein CM15mV9_1380 [uncultured marine virus]
MPNWCYNRINVFGDGEEKTTEQIKKIEKIFESKTPFNEIFPMPDWKNTPNSKGELPKLEQHEKSRWFNYSGKLITFQMAKMMIAGITGALKTGVRSGSLICTD